MTTKVRFDLPFDPETDKLVRELHRYLFPDGRVADADRFNLLMCAVGAAFIHRNKKDEPTA
jgi:hypothetical protein